MQVLGNYVVGRTIGRGSFGKVKQARHIVTNELVAIKILSQTKLKSASMDLKIHREIKILKLFSHPNICRLYEVIETPAEIYLIVEHVEGGELYNYIVEREVVPEAEARYIFQQLICALEYCHHFRVVHRDLKPENILLGPGLQVKLIDFGLSNIMQDGQFLSTSCGSANYAAPEVIAGKLYGGPEVDVWSCGVILYALLCGCLPFDEATVPALFSKIKRGIFTIPLHVNPQAAELIHRLLTVDPLQRLTLPQIRDDPWFNTNLPPRMSFHSTIVGEGNLRLHASVVSEVARRLQCREKEVWREVEMRRGKGYLSYCILADARQRRRIANEFKLLQATEASLLPVSSTCSAPAQSAAASSSSVGGGASAPAATSLIEHSHSASQYRVTPPPAPVSRMAAVNVLNLGLLLSPSPAMEALLERCNARSTKEAYNSCTFIPASVANIRSGGGSGGGGLMTYSSSLGDYSSTGGPGGELQANRSLLGSFSMSRRPKGDDEPCNSVTVVHSVSGSTPNNNTHNPTTTATTRSRSHNPLTTGSHTVRNSLVGSVVSSHQAYSATERQLMVDHNAGWRLGYMTDVTAEVAMQVIYRVLRTASMQWKKSTAPFEIIARTTPQTWVWRSSEYRRRNTPSTHLDCCSQVGSLQQQPSDTPGEQGGVRFETNSAFNSSSTTSRMYNNAGNSSSTGGQQANPHSHPHLHPLTSSASEQHPPFVEFMSSASPIESSSASPPPGPAQAPPSTSPVAAAAPALPTLVARPPFEDPVRHSPRKCQGPVMMHSPSPPPSVPPSSQSVSGAGKRGSESTTQQQQQASDLHNNNNRSTNQHPFAVSATSKPSDSTTSSLPCDLCIHFKISVFRIHEKHSRGYVVDWSVQDNFMAGMDLANTLIQMVLRLASNGC